MTYPAEQYLYDDPVSPTSSTHSGSDSTFYHSNSSSSRSSSSRAHSDTASDAGSLEEEETGVRPLSPINSITSLSQSFSSIATEAFVELLDDIEFAPAAAPSEIVPQRYWSFITRGKKESDMFEEPREETIEIPRLPLSYAHYVEYGIPLSRFLFKDYWRSYCISRGWDEDDEREMAEFEESQRQRELDNIQALEEKRYTFQRRSSLGTTSIRVQRKPSSLALSSLRFASMDDDQRSEWWFRSDGNGGIKFNEQINELSEDDHSDELPSSDSDSSSDTGHASASTTTLAQEYRRRFGGTWNVIQMAGGKVPRVIDEMHAAFMRSIVDRS